MLALLDDPEQISNALTGQAESVLRDLLDQWPAQILSQRGPSERH